MGKSEFKYLVEKTINRLKEPDVTPLDDLFDELAVLLLTRGELQVGKAKFRFIEIEFYLNDDLKEGRFDPYAHPHYSFPI